MKVPVNARVTISWDKGADDWPKWILSHCRQAAPSPIAANTAKKKPVISSTRIRVARAVAFPTVLAAATPPLTA